MNPPADLAAAWKQCVWVIPPVTVQLAGGEFLIRSGKPIATAGARVTSKLTGLSPKTLARLAESGFIRVAFPTPGIAQYFPGEVLAFIAQTIENPDYWTPERRRQYGLARQKKP
jgi:hypothetical protein